MKLLNFRNSKITLISSDSGVELTTSVVTRTVEWAACGVDLLSEGPACGAFVAHADERDACGAFVAQAV